MQILDYLYYSVWCFFYVFTIQILFQMHLISPFFLIYKPKNLLYVFHIISHVLFFPLDFLKLL